MMSADYVDHLSLKYSSNMYGKMSDNSVTTTPSAAADEESVDWELRPGGMLVQRRSGMVDVAAVRNLRLRIAYGALRYEKLVSPQASFGEVKKVLTGETGLLPDEQRLVYRGKERENGEFLDICGVKDRSKVILIQDPISVEKRYMEMRKNAKFLSVHRAISQLSEEVDKLAEQVSAMETSISKGTKVAEVQITTLTEMLMRLAVKLDGISAEGDASARKISQCKRVQKCVEALDVLKVSNANVKPVVVTTKWETFDPPPTTPHWEIFD